MALLAPILDGLNENCSMNNLEHWFQGFECGQDAIDLYGETIEGETDNSTHLATLKALNELYYHEVNDIEHAHAQAIIKEWNLTVWGVNFVHNGYSVPFSG